MHPRATIALVINVVAWGATPVLLKLLVDHVDAWTANGLRYPFSALLFLPFVLASWRRGTLPPGIWKRALVPAACSLGGQVLWALSPYYLPAELIGFLLKGSMVFALVGAMLLFPDERYLLRSGRFRLGLALTIGGFVGLSYLQGIWTDAADETTATGIVIMVFCCAFFGLYAVALRRFMTDVSPILGFGVIAQYVAAGAIVLMAACGDWTATSRLDGEGWTWILTSSLVGIALSHVLYIAAIRSLGATIAASAHLAGPFVTALLASSVLGVTLAFDEWVAGIAMVAGGTFLISAQRRS